MKRRVLLKGAVVLGGAGVLPASVDPAEASSTVSRTPSKPAKREVRPMPKRILGRTGVKVSILGFGLATLQSDNTSHEEANRMIREAVSLGITYLDVSPDYGNAEDKLREPLRDLRNDVFLVTKVNPQSPDRQGVQRQLEASLRRMGVDTVDAVHLHNLGDFEMDSLLASDGALAGLREARKRGLCRFIGISGHMRPHRFATVIDTGEIDLAMVALNFADRHTYPFEEIVLPPARRHGTGIVAMKVLGGAVDWRYDGKTSATLAEYHEKAIRYSLGLPGVASAVIGLSNQREIAEAVRVARGYRPLREGERSTLLQQGKRLAGERGQYFGPVVG